MRVWYFQRENGWCKFSLPHAEVALESGKRAYYAVEFAGEEKHRYQIIERAIFANSGGTAIFRPEIFSG